MSIRKESKSTLLLDLFGILNAIVELYLTSIIKPFLTLHEKFYKQLNAVIRSFLDTHSEQIPEWFTANFITYARTVLVIPCVMMLVNNWLVIPSLMVLLVDFGDFLDGVVARYWVDKKKDDKYDDLLDMNATKIQSSWIVSHRNSTYGGFIDAVCDKAFVAPCWLALLHSVPSSSHIQWVQYIVLWCLILAETTSGCIRFKAFYTSNGVPAPAVQGLNFSTSAVKADHIGKAKQTFEMVGTALFILPGVRYLGLLLLAAAVPLAYESVRRKVNTRVMYVDGTTSVLDHGVLKFWKQAKGMGSKLVVGIVGEDSTTVENARASESVEEVVSDVPAKVDLEFLDGMGCDFVVCLEGTCPAAEDVIAAQRCLVIRQDGVAHVLEAKGEKKE